MRDESGWSVMRECAVSMQRSRRRPFRLLAAASAAACAIAVASCGSSEDSAPEQSQPSTAWTNDLGIPLSTPLVGPEPGHTKKMQLASGRTFLLHVPEGYTPERSWPIILVFHGWNETIDSLEVNTGFSDSRAIVAYPQGVDGAWSPAPYAKTSTDEDLQFVHDMVDGLRSTYRVNDNEIFAAGMSNGGGFAAFLACRMPETFHSVATVSAAYYEGIHDGCTDRPVGRLDLHGTKDPVVSYDGGVRHETPYASVKEVLHEHERRNRCSGKVESVRLTNGAEKETWIGCEAPLQHIRIEGGSHIWPGGFNTRHMEVGPGFATDAVLDFFGIPGRPANTKQEDATASTTRQAP